MGGRLHLRVRLETGTRLGAETDSWLSLVSRGECHQPATAAVAHCTGASSRSEGDAGNHSKTSVRAGCRPTHLFGDSVSGSQPREKTPAWYSGNPSMKSRP